MLECVGTREAIERSIGVVRVGCRIGRVGVAQNDVVPLGIREIAIEDLDPRSRQRRAEVQVGGSY